MAKEHSEKDSIFFKLLIVIFTLTALASSGLLIYGIFLYNGIESLIRYIIIGLLALNGIRILFKAKKIIKGKYKKKKPKKKLFLVALIIYSIIFGLVGYYLLDIYGKINGVNKTNVTYTSYLITLKESKAESVKDISVQFIRWYFSHSHCKSISSYLKKFFEKIALITWKIFWN